MVEPGGLVREVMGKSASTQIWRHKHVSLESVYSVYTVDNQQPKCLHNSLHFLKSVYTIGCQ